MVDQEEPMEVEEGSMDDATSRYSFVPMEDEDMRTLHPVMSGSLFDVSRIQCDHFIEDKGGASPFSEFLRDDMFGRNDSSAMNTDPFRYQPEYPLSVDDLIFHEHEIERGVSKVNFKHGYFVGYNRRIHDTAVVKRLHVSHKQEVEIIKKLQHPNIIGFLAYVEKPNFFHFLVLEFAELGSLFDVLKNYRLGNHQLPEDLISRWCYQLCDAVKYLHSKFILHRDIKSGNMICSPNILKLGDFGLSRETGGLVSHISTSVGRGTHRWMAPEVVTKHHHSPSSDAYSMSMVFLELCTCNVPFNQIAIAVTVPYHVVNNNLRPDIPPHAPQYLKTLLPRCWVEDARNRPGVPEILDVIVDAMPPTVGRELLSGH
ncbi:mitogen-activated protein kinase kinase kinase A-like [Amphiura filiformis]|uniref:mitogen-activated protein kinase kinase kinase A-like n=1 Tax=Amphiura filiformis TaxID=82378 RepID=UPI003B21442A